MDPYLKVLVPAIVVFLTSSGGFWAYLVKRKRVEDASTRMLMGLVQDKITTLGMDYIKRGYITHDEYTDLVHYFYKPYIESGGNGSAERMMHAVERLPFSEQRSPLAEITETTTIRSTDRTGEPPTHA